jgi:outer membrane protein TolC
MAMLYRLDLQNRRDQLDDTRRDVDNALNQLLPDLNLTGTATLATDPNVDYGGVEFDLGEINAQGGVTLGLPLDREIERVNVRQAQIAQERAMMEFERFRDEVAVNVRGDIRDIDTAIFSLQLQEENIRVNEVRRASLEADPDRATARDRSEAIQQLNQAEDVRDRALRDLQLAILRYLLDTGQLRVANDGTLQMLPGMVPVPIDIRDPVPEVPDT